nr:hypothetical protein [Tanacetum cinerariifolium]
MVSDAPISTAKNLVMGQVKILKRGEPLDESLTVLKDNNDRKVLTSTATAATTTAVDRKASRKVTPAKKKSKKEKKVLPNPNISNSTMDELKLDDFALSSTDRLGPDPDMVPKKNNMANFFFTGSAFVDSPPPSSIPLPGFFTKSFVKEDARKGGGHKIDKNMDNKGLNLNVLLVKSNFLANENKRIDVGMNEQVFGVTLNEDIGVEQFSYLFGVLARKNSSGKKYNPDHMDTLLNNDGNVTGNANVLNANAD